MSGLGMRVRLQDMDLPPRVLQQMANADTTPLMADIGDYVLSETLYNFDQEQSPKGEQWPQSQRAQEEGGKTLQDRGHLRDSYTYNAQRDRVEIGSNIIYAAIHHFGGVTGRNHATELPARTALGITPEMEGDIGDMVLDFYRRHAA